MKLLEFKANWIPKLDKEINDFFSTLNLAPKLNESLVYSYFAGGKRLRPLLLLATLAAFEDEIEKGLKTAAALEMMHTGSLVHDDLPAMDDDDYRRGKLTNHKVFGEATSVLAGDSLMLDAARLITIDPLLNDAVKVHLVTEFTTCAGSNGMVGGQQLDMESEDQDISIETLNNIYSHKTGKLIEFAVIAGGLISNQSEQTLKQLRGFAHNIGLAFQVKDDLLDYTGDEKKIGKPINSDQKNHKTTYYSIYGPQQTNELLQHYYERAMAYLNQLTLKSDILIEICDLIIKRDN